MEKTEELNNFLLRADELLSSQYILADTRIINLLKSIATSSTLMAVFKNCLTDFSYKEAKKKYLVKSKYLGEDKGEYLLPKSSREILAFTFNILVEIDSKELNFSEFVDKYFYEDGSFFTSYQNFLNNMIKPFRDTVKNLMESVISGSLQDPIEAITEEEERKEKEREEKERQEQLERELSLKSYGESLKQLREILLLNKTKIKDSKLSDGEKSDLILLVDAFANALTGNDKDAITYTFVSYKYASKVHWVVFSNTYKKVNKLIKEVLNGI